ncbi:MAG TPA: hypothetical protein VMX97_16360, partial [Hyphomicrobiaceae bacterium]|nr:hypothetical protein [Hyphomicrobiaceae bacterium]
MLSQSWEKQSDRMQRHDLLMRGVGILRKDLSALKRMVRDDAGQAVQMFYGRAGSLSFVTLTDTDPAGPGLVYVNYAVEGTSRGRNMVRRTARMIAETPLHEVRFTSAVKVIENAARLGFAFRSDSAAAGGWSRAWTDTGTLPGLVRLDVGMRQGTPVPPVTIGLAASAEQVCVAGAGPLCTIASGLAENALRPVDSAGERARGIQ